MLRAFMNRISGSRSGRETHKRGTKAPRRVCLGVESLENRELLSATVPNFMLQSSVVSPLGSSAPTLRPATNQQASAASPGTVPAAPAFTATALSGKKMDITWQSVSGATGYLVDEWISGAWSQIGSFGKGATSDTVKGLIPGTTYYFDVAAFNPAGASWANFLSATTLIVVAPAAPSFTVTTVSSTRIDLSWSSVPGAKHYLVDEWINGAWTQIDRLGSGATSDTITGLNAGTTYYFDVAARNAGGISWGTDQSATTTAVKVTVDHPAAGVAYTPVTGSLFGANGPSYLDVVQGNLGDCWLLASLAEVAARDPQDITNMFTYDGTAVENGSVVGIYTVRLFDTTGTARSIQVDTELPGGGSMYDHPANGVLWVALAEKAYAEANGAGYVTTGNLGKDSYSALNDGDPSWALHAVTGNAASDFAVNPSSIVTAWNAGELVVLCTSSPASSVIVPSHCYAVVAFNPSSGQPFQVYNPWGTDAAGWAPGYFNGHQVYGLFWANSAFLSQNFTSQSFDVGEEEGTGGQVPIEFTNSVGAPSTTMLTSAVARLSPVEATGPQMSNGTNADAYWASLEKFDWSALDPVTLKSLAEFSAIGGIEMVRVRY